MTTKHQLDQLIEGVKSANGWSDPDLVRNAKERNHVISKANISRLRGPVVSITAGTILALAAGLRVSPAQVAIAAIESMGIALPQYDSPTPEQSIRDDVSLAARDKDALMALLTQLRRAQAAGASGQTQEDKKIRVVSDRTKGGELLPDGIPGQRRAKRATK